MRRVWDWCVKWLPEDQTDRLLVVTVVVSVLLHVLIGMALIMGGNLEQQRIASKRGEALLVDLAPDKPKETAPLGDPSRHAGPNVPEPPRQAAPPTPKAPSLPPAAAAPRAAEAPKAAPKAPPPAPRSAEPGPAPKEASPAPEPDQSQTAKASPTPQPAQPQPPAPAANPRVASVPPQPSPAAGMYRGGGGGLKGGRGGIEGEAIPLDTPDPNYQDYFNQIRERIKSVWIYPTEAARLGIDGELLIEFGIAKSGALVFIEKRQTSSVAILDYAAMHAVELASPFPPVPDAIRKTGGLAILCTFRYQIYDNSKMINRILR